MAQVYSIEISGDKMFGIPKHNPLMFRLKIMTVSSYDTFHNKNPLFYLSGHYI